jgi:hypothetical protein
VDRRPGAPRRPAEGPVTAHQAGIHRLPLRRSEPAGQARRGSGRQPQLRGDLLASGVSALPVQPCQEVLPGQLRRCDPGQHLPGPEATIPLLQRPNASSSASITPSRPHSSVTAAMPAFAVSEGSGSPTRPC